VQRVVEDALAPRILQDPVWPVREQAAVQALDLDEIESTPADDEQVDLTNMPARGGKGEI
jgi:hypothetical protein